MTLYTYLQHRKHCVSNNKLYYIDTFYLLLFRPFRSRHRHHTKSDLNQQTIEDIELIDQYFDHPNKNKRLVRFRRRRPLLPLPLPFFPKPRRRRRFKRVKPGRPRKQVPFSHNSEPENIISEIFKVFLSAYI